MDQPLLITHATPADVPELAAIEAACFPAAEAAAAASIAERVRTYPECFWVVRDLDAGPILAFVNGMATNEEHLADAMYDDVTLHDPAGAWQMLFSVACTPSRRGEHLPTAALERAILDTLARGRRGLVLTCKEPLIGFYARLGFVDEGISASEHGGAEWHEMRLKL